MLAIGVIAIVVLAALAAGLAVYGVVRSRRETRDDLRRAGRHPAPAAYEPGSAYARTMTGGGVG